MSIITLTTDFGRKDHFVGALKGKILTQLPNVQIVDISHEIDCFNISEASYVLRAGYYNFPKGTVHLIGVDSERTIDTKHIVVLWDNHYFVCADNGIMSLVCQNQIPDAVVEINVDDKLPDTATDLDVLLAVACHIAKGGKLEVIGKKLGGLKLLNQLQAVYERNILRGNIIYFDHFGNCVTNITKEMFSAIHNGRSFEIRVNDFRNRNQKSNVITRISSSYSDFVIREGYSLRDYEGEKLALFNEAGYLEIAIYKSNPKTTGTAKSLLGLKFWDNISIAFQEV